MAMAAENQGMVMLPSEGFLSGLVRRTVESWNKANEETAARTLAGKQPYLPGTDLGTMMCANVLYLIVGMALYQWMRRREKGFSLKPVLLTYNFSCVLLAGYVVVGWLVYKWQTGHPAQFVCNPTIRTPDGDQLAFVFWVFFAQKFWEYLDTYFFILRKSFRQVTFLHVFHHCSINVVTGLILPHDYNGDIYIPIVLNALVHVLMYSHYLVAALGFKTPWKKWLTSMQLLQFCMISVHSTMAYFYGNDCGSPDFAKVMGVAFMGSMLVLFGQFFFKAYILKIPDPTLSGVMKNVTPSTTLVTRTGTANLGEGDKVTYIPIPKDLPPSEDMTYHVTPIGKSMPGIYVTEQAPEGTFGVGGGEPGGRIFYQVSANVVSPLPKPRPKARVRCPPTPMAVNLTGCCNPDQQNEPQGQPGCIVLGSAPAVAGVVKKLD